MLFEILRTRLKIEKTHISENLFSFEAQDYLMLIFHFLLNAAASWVPLI